MRATRNHTTPRHEVERSREAPPEQEEMAREHHPHVPHVEPPAEKPSTVGVAAAAIAGGVVFAAAVIWGAAEVAVGAGAAYLAYRLLSRRHAEAGKAEH
jgi:hypothetical protein